MVVGKSQKLSLRKNGGSFGEFTHNKATLLGQPKASLPRRFAYRLIAELGFNLYSRRYSQGGLGLFSRHYTKKSPHKAGLIGNATNKVARPKSECAAPVHGHPPVTRYREASSPCDSQSCRLTGFGLKPPQIPHHEASLRTHQQNKTCAEH